MNVQNFRGLSAALVLGLGLGAWAAWVWQANSYDKALAEQAEAYGRDREQAAVAVIDWQEAEQERRRTLEESLRVKDDAHYRESSHAQKDMSRLRDRLATADLRLSVLLDSPAEASGCAVPATAGTGSVVHGRTRAQLDPAHAQRIVAITGDGDQGLIALAACQAYAKAVSTAK